MKIISFDPSGNHGKEGMGTTGVTFMKDGKPQALGEIRAQDFPNEVEYWLKHIEIIREYEPDHVVWEGYKLYNHRGNNAQTQANSEIPTLQLIGILKASCYKMNIPYSVQFASEVKTRWSDRVLRAKEYLDENNRFKGQATNTHRRDSLRHALHFYRYKLKER